MGASSTTPSAGSRSPGAVDGRRQTVINLPKASNMVNVDMFLKNHYLPGEGLLSMNRYVLRVSFTRNPAWVANNAHRLRLPSTGGSEPVDVLKYVAHKLAVLNWLNTRPEMAGRFCLALHDRHTVVVPMHLKSNYWEVEVQVILQVCISFPWRMEIGCVRVGGKPFASLATKGRRCSRDSRCISPPSLHLVDTPSIVTTKPCAVETSVYLHQPTPVGSATCARHCTR